MDSFSPLRVSVAPKALRACAVWSRVRMDSARLVVPSACRPAKRTQVLTWALGMGVAKSMACSGRPRIVIGACPSIRSSCAPIWLSGIRIRSIGRKVREWSPIRVKVCGCGATRPASMRMVEPELPQSSGATGWQKAPATPVTSTAVAGPEPWRTIVAPSDDMQASEDCGSAPVEKFASREVPSARPASRA